MIRAGLAGAVAVLALAGLWLHPAPDWRFAPGPAAVLGTGPDFETVFDYTAPEGTAHAPALTVDGDVIWFDGIREGHNEVRILRAELGTDAVGELFRRQLLPARFAPPQTILTLGNTVGDGRGGHLTTVVTLGGWAAASVAHLSAAGARKLSLSPILNRSHLVKSPVLPMAGGGVLLPTYFEMEGGYGVAALLDADGRVRGQGLMRGGFPAIQPLILPTSERDAVALLRRFSRDHTQLLASFTRDGGRSWTAPVQTGLPNPNAPVAGVRLADGRLLILYNDAPDRADTLRFAISADGGQSWRPGRVLDGPGKGQLRYPMMRVRSDGRIAVTYSTHSKSRIVTHVITADWAVAP